VGIQNVLIELEREALVMISTCKINSSNGIQRRALELKFQLSIWDKWKVNVPGQRKRFKTVCLSTHSKQNDG
jgi:hypothetical protein